MSFRQDAKDSAQMKFHFSTWFILIALLLGGAVTVTYIMKPVWLGLERKAFVASHQYIEAQRTKILTLSANYRRAEAGQKEFIRDQIRDAAAKLPRHEIPQSALSLLNQ